MHSAFNAVTSGSTRAIRSSVLANNALSPFTSSPRARCTVTMVSTSATVASFITLDLATDCAADRWKTFLSNISRTTAASGFDMTDHASIVAKWWHGYVRASANAATAS